MHLSRASCEALRAAQVPQMIHFVRIRMLGYSPDALKDAIFMHLPRASSEALGAAQVICAHTHAWVTPAHFHNVCAYTCLGIRMILDKRDLMHSGCVVWGPGSSPGAPLIAVA